ncbi:MAG: hypothetical protein ABW005_07580 [Burkholderiaceae bacterium]
MNASLATFLTAVGAVAASAVLALSLANEAQLSDRAMGELQEAQLLQPRPRVTMDAVDAQGRPVDGLRLAQAASQPDRPGQQGLLRAE